MVIFWVGCDNFLKLNDKISEYQTIWKTREIRGI